MPQEEYVWLPRQELLTFEEIARLVEVFTSLGVEDVRLTGGEPLLRRDLPQLIRMLAANPRIRDLALTTNGVLFAEHSEALRAAGLHRVTLSLDTLRPERFSALAGRDTHAQVLEGVAAARRLGFPKLKLDTVVLRGVNDDELADLIEYGRGLDAEVRFIETSAAPRNGRSKKFLRARKCLTGSRNAMERSRRSTKIPPRPPSASVFPTAHCSASSHRLRRRFAEAATAAA
jgi:molybdenum cofactor biosynthesis enzyme MoaA